MSCIESAASKILFSPYYGIYILLYTLFICNGCNGTKNSKRERDAVYSLHEL